jgi:hypothetical protein
MATMAALTTSDNLYAVFQPWIWAPEPSPGLFGLRLLL